jgi:hypothetical protein
MKQSALCLLMVNIVDINFSHIKLPVISLCIQNVFDVGLYSIR